MKARVRRAVPRPVERPKSLTDIAEEELRQFIIEGQLEMGEMLSESALAASLGISKTPVREALVRMRNEGLVTIIPQKGTFVFTATPKELRDLCVVRTSLEPSALQASFERDQEKLAKGLAKVVDAMRAARARDDTREYLRLDTQYHDQFFEHSDNAFLCAAYQVVRGKMAALRTRLGMDLEHLKKSFDEHAAIAELIAQGDSEKAKEILINHISTRAGSYWKKLEDNIE